MGAGFEADPAVGVRVSTDGAPPGEVFDWWQATTDTMIPLSLSNPVGVLDAAIHARLLGPIFVADVDCSRLETRRTPRDIARGGLEACYVFEQLGPQGSAFVTPAGDEPFVAVGDMVLGDGDAPFASFTESRFSHRIWLIPRTYLAAEGAAASLERGVRLRRASPIGRLLSAYLGELRSVGRRLSPEAQARCTGVAARLIALAAGGGGAEEPHLEAVEAGRIAEVRRRIERRLTDPLLSPSRIAAECGISVRRLHALFEPTGQTFSAYVTGRRLEVARARLEDPALTHEPVTDLAFALGFNSLSTFYRAYREAFGEPPGETRARAASLR